VAQRRIAILMTVLSAMSERVTEAQKSSFVKMESLNEDLAEAEKFLEGLETEKSKASARSAELQAKIDALESAIKNAIQQGKDHNKQVEELKRQKAEVDAKIRGLTNAIASAKAKIASIEGDIAACANAIGAATMNEVAAAVKAAAGSAPAPEESESQAEIEKQEKKAEANNPVNVIREALDRLDADILRTIEENQVVKA
jgi:chromosome segregation ATPase